MADYSSLGSFSTGGASALNGDLIQRLYDADTVSLVNPITEDLELIDTETEVISNINTLISELTDSIEVFDLYYSGNNVFEQISASTTGESAVFDASDIGALKEGTINVSIDQLAQKDAYQSNSFSSPEDLISGGQDSGDLITINGTDFSTEGITYEELVEDINLNGLYDASLVQVTDDDYRLVIKSKDPGEDNALTITQTNVDLGLEDTSGTDENGIPDGSNINHVLQAQNLKATVDGVDFDISSNSITLDGNLKITASAIGDSAISVQKDDSSVVPAIEDFAAKYNELVAAVKEETYSDNPSVKDKSSLSSLVSNIKEMMFGEYGDNDESLLSYGFGFNEDGYLEIDTTILGAALTEDTDNVISLFIGVAEDEGFGTALKSHLDGLYAFDGLFSLLEDGIETRQSSLEEEREKAIEDLDTKYDIMAAQFAAYAAVITSLESSFSSLGYTISENTSDS